MELTEITLCVQKALWFSPHLVEVVDGAEVVSLQGVDVADGRVGRWVLGRQLLGLLVVVQRLVVLPETNNTLISYSTNKFQRFFLITSVSRNVETKGKVFWK